MPNSDSHPMTTLEVKSELGWDTVAGDLELPRILDSKPNWTSEQTRQHIGEACGRPNNIQCLQCGKQFSSHRQLRVHVPQHFTIIYCPCGEFNYQRDYVLKHQRIARCYMGKVFVVDATNFVEFRDLILPYVSDAWKRWLLLQGFPQCRPAQRDAMEKENPHGKPDLPSTQLLPVIVEQMKDIPLAPGQEEFHRNRHLPMDRPARRSTHERTAGTDGRHQHRRREEWRARPGFQGSPYSRQTGVSPQQAQALEDSLSALSCGLERSMDEVERLRRDLQQLQQVVWSPLY